MWLSYSPVTSSCTVYVLCSNCMCLGCNALCWQTSWHLFHSKIHTFQNSRYRSTPSPRSEICVGKCVRCFSRAGWPKPTVQIVSEGLLLAINSWQPLFTYTSCKNAIGPHWVPPVGDKQYWPISCVCRVRLKKATRDWPHFLFIPKDGRSGLERGMKKVAYCVPFYRWSTMWHFFH